MPNRVFLTALAADAVFLLTGCLVLGYSLVIRSQMNNEPADGREAVGNLLYQRFPLNAGIANGAFIIVTFFFTIPGFASPMRKWLQVSGYLITGCGLFSLCLGAYLWVMTLRTKETLFPVYVDQDPSVQHLIQTSFECCGYYNQSTPAFVTDQICPSPAAAALIRGCGTAVASFANTFVNSNFTAIFGMVGIDVVLILAIACLLKDRKERERYRHIDEKSGYRSF